MAAQASWTDQGLQEIAAGTINWTGANIKVMALNPFTINLATQAFINSVSANQITGVTGYTAGGLLLTGKSVYKDTVTQRSYYRADNPTWTITGTMSAQVFAVYRDTGTPSTSPILFFIDKGAMQTRTDTDFILQFTNTYMASVRRAA
jgi:hypothetical protein